MDTDLTSSNSEICSIEKFNDQQDDTSLNSREKELIKFNNEMLTYPVEQAKFLAEFRDVFIPDDDYLLPSMNIHPVKLATKSDIIVPTPSPARRNYSKNRIDRDAL